MLVLLTNKARLAAQARSGPQRMKMATLSAQRCGSGLLPRFLATLAQRGYVPRKVIFTKV